MSDSVTVGQLVLAYLSAFNSRDESAMRACFNPSLITVHPDDPSLDVLTCEPFLERMVSLWSKDFYYQLHDLSEVQSCSDSSSLTVFAEFSIGVIGSSPVATEMVRYSCSDLIDQITVYKIFHPKHPNYNLPIKNTLSI